MAQTVISGAQIKNATVQRQDLDTSTVGQAVVTKVVQGTNVTLSSTGADSGTGDVTISVPTGGQGPAGPAGIDSVTTTSGSFTVPPIGSTTTVTVVNASWIVVGQMVYVDQAGGGTGLAGALQVTAKAGNLLTLLNPAAPPVIPLADATQSGLLRQVSGNATDFVDGTNHPVDLGATILGQAAITNAGLTKSILVPRYALHPDAIWTYGTFDDHFDTPSSGTPNAKWVRSVTGGASNPIFTQAASKLCLGVQSAASSATVYGHQVVQQLPVQATHIITLKALFAALVPNANVGNYTCYGNLYISLEYGTSGGGVAIELQVFENTSGSFNMVENAVYIGAGANFPIQNVYVCSSFPPYWQIFYDASKNTTLYFSFDAVTWMPFLQVAAATSGFATNAPSQFRFAVQATYLSAAYAQIDWIKHV